VATSPLNQPKSKKSTDSSSFILIVYCVSGSVSVSDRAVIFR
jgi:hypothetical protein